MVLCAGLAEKYETGTILFLDIVIIKNYCRPCSHLILLQVRAYTEDDLKLSAFL